MRKEKERIQMRIDKKKALSLFVSVLLFASLILVNLNSFTSAQVTTEPIYLHGPSLAPIHMNSNITLTPIHMHSAFDWVERIYEPECTYWHELYPNYCPMWHLTSWVDKQGPAEPGYGELSPNDQIDMTDQEGNVTWFHVDRMTITLVLSRPYPEPTQWMFVELKAPPIWTPYQTPVCTLWHEVNPIYSNVYHCVNWTDNGSGRVDKCDFVNMTNTQTQVTTQWHVEGVYNDIILRWKMMNPICTWWHEIYPNYCRWRHITSWESYPDQYCDRLSPMDQIDMVDEQGVKTWYFVDRVTVTLNVTYLEHGEVPKWMKIELKTHYFEEMYEVFKRPVGTAWHEVYPNYSNIYNLTLWDPYNPDLDNCNGVLDVCDHIWLYNITSRTEQLYHIEDMTYDLILNKKISNPVCTDWLQLYPTEGEPSTWYHVDWWKDNLTNPYTELLSPCDLVKLTLQPQGPTELYHVINVSVTIKLSLLHAEPYIMYLEAWLPFEYMYWAKLWGGVGEFYWHEIWPQFSNLYYVPWEEWAWEDNCNGVLDRCDNITLYTSEGGYAGYWHVEEVCVDMVVEEVPTPPPPPPMYWKPSYQDYAISGMPDFDQRQWGTYNWTNNGLLPPKGTWSHCAPTAIANSLWWLDSEFERNTIPPPAIIDNFPLVKAYGQWDDHSPANVQPLIQHLAYLMDTDGRRTSPPGVPYLGTTVNNTQAGLAQYLSWSGVNPLGDVNGDGEVNATDYTIVVAANNTFPGHPQWNMAADIWPITLGWPGAADNIVNQNDINLVNASMGQKGMFYERTVPRPEFDLIEEEVEKCEDVVITLGFWHWTGATWIYYDYPYPYGHAVTVAGINSTLVGGSYRIAISDPAVDAFEAGLTSEGRSPIPHWPHLPPEPPFTTHNDAALVSHDIYNVTQMPIFPIPCPGGNWTIMNYSGAPPGYFTVIENAIITSPLGVHDIAVTNITLLRNGLHRGFCIGKPEINVTVENHGNFPENFNVTCTGTKDLTIVTIGVQAVALNPGQNITIQFDWDTTWLVPGNYTISAAAPLAGDINPGDNSLQDGIIEVVLEGDVAVSGVVDIDDLVSLIYSWGSFPGHQRWYVYADIDCTNVVELDDLLILIYYWGSHWP